MGVTPEIVDGAEDAEPIVEGRPRRATVTAVAQAAGVSIATVSKVVNGRPGVGKDTRSRVEAVIRELGYVTLGDRQGAPTSPELGVEIVVDPRSVSNPYLASLLGGAMDAATEHHAALVLRSIDAIALETPAAWAHQMREVGRSGVVEVTSAYSPQREAALKRAGLPMVLVDPIDVPRTSTPSIGATNWAGGYSATQHLLGLGHREVRYLGGHPKARCDLVRAHGWAAAMSEAGLPADLSAVPRGAYTYEHGLTAAAELLSLSRPPTAIFAGSDTCAMGVLEAARRRGLRIPDDLSVVGFDDTVLAQTSTPPLTTVHQPISDIGRTAVTQLLRLASGESLATKRLELATHLVIRDTTAPPR